MSAGRLFLFCLGFLVSLIGLVDRQAWAQAPSPGEVLTVPTRPGVTVPVYVRWRPDAVATLVLYSGGGGGYGPIGDDGWPTGGNFLIRTGKHWASYPFNLAMVGRPSDGIDLALGGYRVGDQHGADNRALFQALKQKSPAPLWLVGTSMGTISAAAAAIRDEDGLVAGVVLTSSIVSYKIPGALPKQALDKIRVPVLVFHHRQDACGSCRPDEVRKLAAQLTKAPVVRTLFVDGGGGVSSGPCEPWHYHGYVGMEDEAVDKIAAWILHPTADPVTAAP